MKILGYAENHYVIHVYLKNLSCRRQLNLVNQRKLGKMYKRPFDFVVVVFVLIFFNVVDLVLVIFVLVVFLMVVFVKVVFDCLRIIAPIQNFKNAVFN